MNNTLPTITPEEINALPSMEFAGEIHVIAKPHQARAAVAELMKEKLLGFDTETRPSFTKGEFYHVSLLQLATKDKAFLFRLCVSDLMPEVIPLLANPDILKVGVATRDDVKALVKLSPFEPAGFFDIAQKLAVGNRTPGLRTLVAEHLGLRLTKAAKTTNWAANYLSPAQLAYAAKDAVAGILLYEKLSPRWS